MEYRIGTITKSYNNNMSTIAYRINKIESEQEPSFNLTWHNNLMEYFHNQYNDSVILDVDVEELQEALKDKKVRDEIGEFLPFIEKDIAWALEKGDTTISYLTC